MSWPFVWAALWAAALALPLSIAAANAALALLTLAVLLRLRGAGRARALRAWRAEPALVALAAYIAVGLLSGALGDGFAKSARDSLKDLHRLWSLGLLVAAFALEPETQPWAALAAGFSLIGAIGVGQSLWAWRSAGTLERAHAFVHPVTFGELTALGTLGGLCWLSRPERGRRARGAALAATSLCAAAATLSETRAALLALAVGAVVVACLEPRARRWAAAALGLGALGAAAGEWLRYGRVGFGAELAAAPSASGQQTRYVLWDVAWRMFRDHPWIGVGPGHYLTEFPRYFSGTLEGQASWGSAHDLYLHQLAERGLAGEAVLLALLGVLLVRAFRAERARRDAASLWAAAAVPAFLVMNLTEVAWQTEQFATLFLLVWAFGTARRDGSARGKAGSTAV
jgi:O-antigen ligase